MLDHTIAAISTSLSASGIGIVRISGDEAIAIADRLFQSHKKKQLKDQKTHTLHYGHIVDPKEDEIVDEVLVSIMRGPDTYTKEDIIEINGHGGVIVMQRILQLVLTHGATLAEPGEFTKRAFLNGRLDLSGAEAVIDIINAKTNLGLKSSMHQLKGAVYYHVEEVRREILELMAHIEASIDYPEYDIEELSDDHVMGKLERIAKGIHKMIQSSEVGKMIREGIKTAIVGKPNVGKSSLLNALLKEDRAIVTDIAGTTRDVLEEYMNLLGIPVRIMDTAGIRQTDDEVEKIGVTKSKAVVEDADLVIMMLDASQKITKEDRYILDLVVDKQVIVLLNKIDLSMEIKEDDIRALIEGVTVIPTSVVDERGLEELQKVIKDMFLLGDIAMDDGLYITNVRHKVSLERALKSVEAVKASIQMGMPEDCWSIDLKNAYGDLGEITGDHVSDDLIEEIFSQFCLGK
ncbi:tRNA uridine-5-carboxymethylaminomethyl(34) synthesis GTPase MnmE [Vallitalea pronyensis]|uniref:tRNA modification GTPase MnmE n=1 Tax=Vallitalea pronyensis TaxID=1348613 RepID=A0A8J8SF94_9FIRM|nr:tRNA uridine-5-carboxymethylaminomethyl(34) synthesis GTPase MnmE [Vallitalea pronyensis]QUI21089.1 tRNA uridine-5-carboxymethylaminomethyl(34) synthesis GTPase MnmE [Vallitalea pronyensis]